HAYRREQYHSLPAAAQIALTDVSDALPHEVEPDCLVFREPAPVQGPPANVIRRVPRTRRVLSGGRHAALERRREQGLRDAGIDATGIRYDVDEQRRSTMPRARRPLDGRRQLATGRC